MEKIKHDILNQSYWEHFKLAKELALLYPVENTRRKSIEMTMNDLLSKINKKNEIVV